MIEMMLKIGLAYLLGSLVGALILGWFRKVDVRDTGSGNAGATNAFRSQGMWFAIAVLIFDIAKGVVAVFLVPEIEWPFGSQPHPAASVWLPYLCGIAVVLGHLYPVFFGFRGGKGVATMLGVLLCVLPGVSLWVLGVWLITLLLSGYVSLATLLAAVTSIGVVALGQGLSGPAGVFVIVFTLLLFYTHRENIRRLRDGSESRFEKAMLLKRFRSAG